MRAEDYRLARFQALIGVGRLEYPTQGGSALPLGAHLISLRRGYLHHGIYVGNDKVVHYSGSTNGLHRGPVQEIPLQRFTCGRAVWIKSRSRHDFNPSEVVRRACSRLGEDRYRVFSNNCEHFCEWCLHDVHRSYQVEALLALPSRALQVAIRFIARLVSSTMTRSVYPQQQMAPHSKK
ncbi:MAG TPA: lecithin retinol acyltransferase family protein [Steroidobacteraceae bacterium]